MSRDKYMMKKFGITEEQYQQMLEAQDHRCAICKQHESHFKNRLAIEHNHKNGIIRGLACYICNRYIIAMVDKYPNRIVPAIEYVKNHGMNTGWHVPKPKKLKRKRK